MIKLKNVSLVILSCVVVALGAIEILLAPGHTPIALAATPYPPTPDVEVPSTTTFQNATSSLHHEIPTTAAQIGAAANPLTASLMFNHFQAVAAETANGPALPTSPTAAEFFVLIPSNGSRNVLMMYTGSAWVPLCSLGAMTIYVSNSGTDNANQGYSASYPFQTLSFAMSQIPAFYSGNITINAAAGTYREQVAIGINTPIGNS
ncbi:MAG: hypothetical protein ABSG42_06860, partial [Nitrospirota bacterium]